MGWEHYLNYENPDSGRKATLARIICDREGEPTRHEGRLDCMDYHHIREIWFYNLPDPATSPVAVPAWIWICDPNYSYMNVFYEDGDVYSKKIRKVYFEGWTAFGPPGASIPLRLTVTFHTKDLDWDDAHKCIRFSSIEVISLGKPWHEEEGESDAGEEHRAELITESQPLAPGLISQEVKIRDASGLSVLGQFGATLAEERFQFAVREIPCVYHDQQKRKGETLLFALRIKVLIKNFSYPKRSPLWRELSGENSLGLNECPRLNENPRKELLDLWICQPAGLWADAEGNEPPPWVMMLELPDDFVFETWNWEIAANYHAALRSVQAAQQISLLPLWRYGDWKKAWPHGWVLVSGVRADGHAGICEPRSIQPKWFDVNEKEKKIQLKERGLEVTGFFPGFRTHAGIPLRRPFALENFYLSAQTPPGNRAQNLFRVEQEQGIHYRAMIKQAFSGGAALFPPEQVRVGALDLTLAAPRDTAGSDVPPASGAMMVVQGDAGKIAASGHLEQLVTWPEDAHQWPYTVRHGLVLTPDVDLNIIFPVEKIAPGGQDALREEDFAGEGIATTAVNDPVAAKFERERPLVIPLGSPASASKNGTAAPYTLTALEKTDRRKSQSLDLYLQDNPDNKQPRSPLDVIVLDRMPFLAALVRVPALGPSGREAEMIQLGYWSNKLDAGAGWQLGGSTDGFALYLPPQGLGEAMEKSNREGNIVEGAPIDFRLCPLSKITLQPSYYKQRYMEAPWNLRRILGYAGQRAPGAEIVDMTFELAYPLSCHVDLNREQRILRLCEITNRMGRLLGCVPSMPPWSWAALPEVTSNTATKELPLDDPLQALAITYASYRKRWGDIYNGVLGRLCVLEPWTEEREDPDTQAERALTLEQGVQYELRAEASLRNPFPDEATAGVPDDPMGLAGGICWGFESRNIYEKVWQQPLSTSGLLARPRFSALGGWGFQKASFDNGFSTIYVDTSMGRTARITLERLGRIGVFWHPAKHIIIYERTVVPSRQFFRDQDPLLGRPLLRKVEEYVELLQPERAYPEYGAAPVTRGFVQACQFHTMKIRVNSRWGGDVGQVGWQVPLWNRQAHEQDPELYPRPQINLMLSADPQAGAAAAPAELLEPDKLVFFTLTRGETELHPDGSLLERINQWPAVPTVDYHDLPIPAAPSAPSMADGNPEEMLPDAEAVEAGYARFTYAVAPVAQGANLTAEREVDAVKAVIRNVTMMRSQARPAGMSDNAKEARDATIALTQCVANAGQFASRLLACLPSLDATDPYWREKMAQISKELEATTAEFETFTKKNMATIEAFYTEYQEELRKDRISTRLNGWWKAGLERWRQRFRSQYEETWNAMSQRALEIVTPPNATLETVETAKQRLVNHLRASVEAFNATVQDIRTGLDDLTAVVNEVSTLITRFQEQYWDLVHWLGRDLEAQIARLKPDGPLEPLEARRLLQSIREQARRELEEYRNRLCSAVDEVLGRITHACQGMMRTVLQNMDDWSDALRERIKRELQALEAGLASQLDTADRAIVTAGDIAQTLNTAAGELNELIAEAMKAMAIPGSIVVRLSRVPELSFWYNSQCTLPGGQELPTGVRAIFMGGLDLDPEGVLHALALEQKEYPTTQKAIQCLIGMKVFDQVRGLSQGPAEWKAVLNLPPAVGYHEEPFKLDQHTPPEDGVILVWRRIHNQDALYTLRFAPTFFQDSQKVKDWVSGHKAWFEANLPDLQLVDKDYITENPVITALNWIRSAITDGMEEKLTRARLEVEIFNDTLAGIIDAIAQLTPESFTELQRQLSDVIQRVHDELDKQLKTIEEQLSTAMDQVIEQSVASFLDGARQGWEALRENLKKSFDTDLAAITTAIKDKILGNYQNALREFEKSSKVLVTNVQKDLDRALVQMAEFRKNLSSGQATEALFCEGEKTLRLLRALGDAPVAQGMAFNRRVLAYYFDELHKEVQMTPVTALVNRAGAELKSFGLRIPVRQLRERLIPDGLQKLSLNSLFPDFAGLRLDDLFPGIPVPENFKDYIHVTHGLDKQTRRAWVQADVDVVLDDEATLFSFGPLAMRILKPRFVAHARIETGPSGGSNRMVLGQVGGDWQLLVGGSPIVIFRDTVIRFDGSGHIHVDLNPRKIELSSLLQMLSDLINSIGVTDESSGITFRLLEQGGLPAGAEMVLNLPLPDIVAGAFGLSNILLGARFRLLAVIGSGGVDFSFQVGFNLGRRENPTAVTIMILSGAGWVDVQATYTPRLRRISTDLSLGLAVGGVLAINLGPIHGAIQVFISVYAEFHSHTAAGGRGLTIAIMFLLNGVVNIAGIITINLRVLLEANYSDDGKLTGHGMVMLEIKVCWAFKLTVHQAIEYQFQGGGAATSRHELSRAVSAAAEQSPYLTAARNYLDLFE